MLLEIPKEEWTDLLVWEDFLRGAGEVLRRAARTFGGNLPRATSLRGSLLSGHFAEWIRDLPAETEEEHYMTPGEPPGLPSQTSLPKRGGSDVLAEVQAATRRQQALSGADRQHAAHSSLGGAASRRSVGGRFANFRKLATDRHGRRQRYLDAKR